MIQQIAAKAVIINDKKLVLVVRKSANYKDGPNAARWDFPGGRLNVGETYQDGLKREAKEETGLDIKYLKPLYVDEWRPVVKGEQLQIVGVFSLCKVKNYEVTIDDENDQFEWLKIGKPTDLDLMKPAADLFQRLPKLI